MVTLTAVLSGCARSPRDYLTGLRNFVRPEPVGRTEEKSSDETLAPADDPSLIAREEEESRQKHALKDMPVAANGARDAAGGDSEQEGSSRLLESLLGKKPAEAAESHDPFLASERKTATGPSQPSSEGTVEMTLEELLASANKPPAASDESRSGNEKSEAWWDSAPAEAAEVATASAEEPAPTAEPAEEIVETSDDRIRFAREFDSRLDRLRAELSQAEPSGPQAADQSLNPFAESSLKVDPLVEEQHPLTGAEEGVAPPVAHVADSKVRGSLARQRVALLMTEAHEYWQNWDLPTAYRTALAAQELAVVENVSFDVAEETPADIAARIAADIRREQWDTDEPEVSSTPQEDALAAVAPVADSTPSTPPTVPVSTKKHTWSTIPAVPSWSQSAGGGAADFGVSRGEAAPESRSSGVSLLAPLDDDFPSESEQPSGPATGEGRSGSDDVAIPPFSTSTWPATTGVNDAAAATSADTTLVRFESSESAPAPVLSAEDEQAIRSDVAATRSRVLESAPLEWPVLPVPGGGDLASINDLPVELSAAPPVALDDTDFVTPPVAAVDGSSAAEEGSSRAWASWVIGGTLLLVTALRLLSRRSATMA
jgi:hypothetical protein